MGQQDAVDIRVLMDDIVILPFNMVNIANIEDSVAHTTEDTIFAIVRGVGC